MVWLQWCTELVEGKKAKDAFPLALLMLDVADPSPLVGQRLLCRLQGGEEVQGVRLLHAPLPLGNLCHSCRDTS